MITECDNMEKRILLIEPPFYRLYKDTYSLTRYPLSLGYLTGTINKKTDWKVMAYNADFYQNEEPLKTTFLIGEGFKNYLNNLKNVDYITWKEVKTVISDFRPSIVAITSKSQNFSSAAIVAKIAKSIDKEIVVIIGGPHPTMIGGKILENSDIDLCVRGEGEVTIIELLDAIENNKKLTGINGISYKDNGKIIDNPPRALIDNLDELCFPHQGADKVLKDYNQYPKMAFKNIFATRGCPYNCFFCGSRNIWGRKVRYRSPDNIVKEINSLQALGVNSIHFDDDTFGVNKKYLKELCLALKEKCQGISWSCEIHVNLVDDENISLMKSAGCIFIMMGVESGNNQLLKENRKNITIEQAFAAAKIIKRHNIVLSVFFIVGFPQETIESLNDTLRAIKKIPADGIVYSIFTPYPGTEAFDFCKEKGLINDSFDVSLYNHQSPLNCFSVNLSREQFRAIANKIEKFIERKNAQEDAIMIIKIFFSKNGLHQFRKRGILSSLKLGMTVFSDYVTSHIKLI